MPKGRRDHSHQGFTMEKAYLKIGGPDPNNRENRTSDTQEDSMLAVRDDGLLPEQLRDIFVQVASIFSMDVNDTHRFMKGFIMPEIKKAEVKDLLDKYRSDIVDAKNAIGFYVDQKFPAFNPFREAEVINKGLVTCEKAIDRYKKYMDKKVEAPQYIKDRGEEAELEWIEREESRWLEIGRKGFSSITKTYESWNSQKKEWGKMINEIISDFSAQQTESVKKSKKLDPRKISNAARRLGVDEFIADRLSQLLVYGEQDLVGEEGGKEKLRNSTSSYPKYEDVEDIEDIEDIEESEGADGNDVLSGIAAK